MGADTVKHVTQIFKRINLTQLATGNQAIDYSGSFGASVTSGEKPVSTSNGYGPKNSLRQIVVYGKVAIANISIQSDPLSAGVTYSLANWTLWQNFNGPIVQATTNLFQNRFALFLT